MPEQPSSNVKIYDRPARTGPSPVLMVIIVLIVLALGFVVYRALRPAAPAPAQQRTSSIQVAQPARNG